MIFSLPFYFIFKVVPICALVFGLRQDQVEGVFLKQSSVQEMFEKRRVSLKKLAAKQTRPVQPVAPRPEVKSPLSSPSKPGSIDQLV